MKRLVAKWRGGYCNIPVSEVKREGDVIFAYRNGEFIGMFDLGCLELFYISENGGSKNELL